MKHPKKPIHPHHKLQIVIGIFISSWLVGTLLIHYFEQGYPIGENYFSALYFTVITTATVGFGDLVPHTIAGKILTMCFAIFYVPMFLYATTLLFQGQYQRFHEAEEQFNHTYHGTRADVHEILLQAEIQNTQTPQ